MSASPGRECPFCAQPPERVLEADPLAVAFADAFPVSPGHALVVPRRHVTTPFELTPEELLACFRLLARMKERLDTEHQPGGYNCGVNVGPAAGQTVFHVHFHLIPRYAGDVPDPVGGIRNVIPGKGRY